MSYLKRRDTCRLCDSESLELAIPMKPSPIGDAFVADENINQELYPLDVYICNDCGHLQNLDVVDPKLLFGSYTYKTSHSLGLVEHFKKYAIHVVNKLGLTEPKLILEIGSNDGSLLKEFKGLGHKVQGVDASDAVSAYANEQGIPTIADFFSLELSKNLLNELGKATLVCANNVYAHADNLRDITAGIRNILTDDGVFVFEVSYLPDMIHNMVFDTIYHEHVSYHTINPLERFFNSLDLSFFDVELVPTKGGSIRGFVQVKSSGRREQSEFLKELMANEVNEGFGRIDIYKGYGNRIVACKDSTNRLLREISLDMTGISGFGASTTTTTLLYNFELETVLEKIYDDNPIKHGLYSPGAHIKVFSSDEIIHHLPKVIVILAWVYSLPIIKKNLAYLEAGGRFIIPLPEPTVVDYRIAKSLLG